MFHSFHDSRVYVKSTVDSRSYLVRNIKEKQASADVLARLNQKAEVFISKLLVDAEVDKVPMLKRLKSRYRPESLTEGKIDQRYSTFTVNKGDSVTFCLRTRNAHDKLYDDNLLSLVFFHELAHIASLNIGHDGEFHRNFAYLLGKAKKFGLYTPIIQAEEYCGLQNITG